MALAGSCSCSHQVAAHQVGIEAQLLRRQPPALAGGLDQPIQIGLLDVAPAGKHHQFAAVGDLALIPRVRPQLLAQLRVADQHKLPGLQAIARGAEHQALLKRSPGFSRDAAAWVKGLGGVAPVQGVLKGGGTDAINGVMQLREDATGRRILSLSDHGHDHGHRYKRAALCPKCV